MLGEGGQTGGVFVDALLPSQWERLRGMGSLRRYERGAALFHERQQSDRVAVILSGRVKLSRVSEDGKEAMLGVRGRGDLIGEMSALDSEVRSATAVALEPVEVLVTDADRFMRFLDETPEASSAVMRTLAQRLRDSDRKRLEYSAQDTMGRIASRLVELAERFGEESPEGEVRIDLPLTQEDLASWTGSSREAVSRALGTMRVLGWLSTSRRSVTVHDLEALTQRSLRT